MTRRKKQYGSSALAPQGTFIDGVGNEQPMPTRRPAHQNLPTVSILVEEALVHPAFRRGVAEARAGLPPRFDEEARDRENCWLYERGRQFAAAAPRDLKIITPRTRALNPRAVSIYWKLGVCK
jgi:hypothetical protein